MHCFGCVKNGLNWATDNLVITGGLTVFTEILFLNYLEILEGVYYGLLLSAMDSGDWVLFDA